MCQIDNFHFNPKFIHMSEYTNNLSQKEPSQESNIAPELTAVLSPPEEGPELTRISISQAILKLAIPAFGSMVILMIFNLVDIWWVGKLGADALAGMSAAAFLVWLLLAIATLVEAGINSMVARFVGAGDPVTAGKVIGQGLILALFMAIVIGVVGIYTRTAVFELMGLSGMILHHAQNYIFYFLAGLFSYYLVFAVDASFRGTGDTKTPLKMITAGLTLNAVLDPFLIFGIGPFPRMEAGGAALATIIAHFLIFVWGVSILQKRQVKIRINRQLANMIDWNVLWRITKIGAPLAFSGVMFSITYMLLTRVLTDFGAAPLAALGLGHRIEGLAYFAAVGFSVAASTLVGQNLGAGKPDRAERSAWLCILYISVILVIVSLAFFFAGKWIILFFINDPEVIREGVAYLKIVALFEVFLGFEIVLEGAFGGSGNSMPPMLVSVPITLARIPLAWYLAHYLDMGSTGVWWAISSTTGLKGIVMALWFRMGRWKKTKV